MVKDQDIIRAARQLRDEENEKLRVRRWQRGNHSRFQGWLTAVPAAAIIGFLLGIWTSSASHDDNNMTALVDTVYVKVHDTQTNTDTIRQVSEPQSKPVKQSKKSVAKQKPRNIPTGHSMADDKIRYDLLVRN